jgi:hypothetical protein
MAGVQSVGGGVRPSDRSTPVRSHVPRAPATLPGTGNPDVARDAGASIHVPPVTARDMRVPSHSGPLGRQPPLGGPGGGIAWETHPTPRHHDARMVPLRPSGRQSVRFTRRVGGGRFWPIHRLAACQYSRPDGSKWCRTASYRQALIQRSAVCGSMPDAIRLARSIDRRCALTRSALGSAMRIGYLPSRPDSSIHISLHPYFRRVLPARIRGHRHGETSASLPPPFGRRRGSPHPSTRPCIRVRSRCRPARSSPSSWRTGRCGRGVTACPPPTRPE